MQKFMQTLRMNRAEFTKKLVYTAMFVAFGILFPMVFHAIPPAGPMLLPMHIPVLLCGLVCGWHFGIVCGIIAPLFSWLFGGMPPTAMLPGMICELAVYGGVSGLLFHFIRTKRIILDLYISLACAMLAGRFTYGILNALIFNAGGYSFKIWVTAAFVTGFPGIVIQLLMIPSLVITFEKAKLIPQRYFSAPDTQKPAESGLIDYPDS